MATLNSRSAEYGPQYDEGIRLTEEPVVPGSPHAQDGPEGGETRGEPPKSSGVNWVIIAAVVAVLAIILIIVIVLVSRGGGSSPSVGPVVGTFVPEVYSINMYPQIQNGTFSGSVAISGNLVNKTSSLELNSVGLTILNITLRSKDSNLTGTNIVTNDETELLRFDIRDAKGEEAVEVPAGDLSIVILFEGKLKDSLRGFYRSSFKVGNETRYMATTQFEPTDARRAFPCFDSPDLKAKFQISIVVERAGKYTVLSNGEKIGSYPLNNKLEQHNFATTPPMSTYLVAFIVGDLVPFKKTNLLADSTGPKINVYTTPEKASQVSSAYDFAVGAVNYYTKRFKIPYQLPKLDLVAIPDFEAGAMENWGLITFRETDLLIAKTGNFRASTQTRERVAKVVCHEIAHQWFGNLVTMKWWNDLWLNEGFASFMEYGCIASFTGDDIDAKRNFWDEFVHHEAQRALAADSLRDAHALSQKIEKDSDIPQMFDGITYAKGATLIRQLETFMEATNPGSFDRGITRYLNAHKNQNAEAADLWAALSTEIGNGVRIDVMMKNWVETPGYPLITIKPTPEKLSYTIEQHRFLASSGPVEPASDWNMQLRYAGKGESVPRYALITDGQEPRTTISAVKPGTKWIKMNYNQTGFYRVNYPIEMWEEFKKEVAVPKELGDADISGLIDDAFAISSAGTSPSLNVTVALDLVQAMSNNTETVSWYSALVHLRKFRRVFTDTESAKDPQPINPGSQSGGTSQNSLLEEKSEVAARAMSGDTLLSATANSSSPSPVPSPAASPTANTTASPSPALASPSPAASPAPRWDSTNYTECEAGLRNFMLTNLHTVARNLSYNGKFFQGAPSETSARMLLRAEVLQLLGELGDTQVTAEARAKFSQINQASTSLSPDLRQAVAIAAVANDYTNGTWLTFKSRYLASTDSAERALYLDGLAFTPSTELISKTLDFALSKDVRQQDGIYLLIRVLHNRRGKDLAFQFIRDKFSDIQDRYGNSSALSRLVFALAESITTESDLRVFSNFFETKVDSIPSARRAVVRGKQAIASNMNWVSQNQDVICDWLVRNNY